MRITTATHHLLLLLIPCLLILLGRCTLTQHIPTPQVFEPRHISTESVEYSSTFSSSGSELYFVRSEGKWGSGSMNSSIYYSHRENGRWSAPKLAPFSGHYNDSGPHLSHDGNTLYFISKRPSEAEQLSSDIWMVEKDKNGDWGAPVRLSDPINSAATEYSPRTDHQGNLYFASTRSGGFGQGDLYMAKKEKGAFSSPVNLGSTINSDKGEWNLEISGDGKILIFEASEREENLSPYGDLYISFKRGDAWTIPQNITELNTTGSDLYPQLHENNKTLSYTSSDSLRSTNTDIYQVEFGQMYKKYKRSSVLAK